MTRQDTRPVGAPGAVNREMREFWTGESLQHWQQNARRWDAIRDPFGQSMLDATRLRPGERVLDIGCGQGATTLDAAERWHPAVTSWAWTSPRACWTRHDSEFAAAGLGRSALREAFTPYASPQGVIMDASAWLVSARR